jgi:hypothetical protein
VLAFKAVLILEQKRRENDRKVIALELDMSDMMSMLLQYATSSFHFTLTLFPHYLRRLRDIRDPNQQAPDGTTVKGRMQKLMETIAKDITNCGNACDIYAKKSTVGKSALAAPYHDAPIAERFHAGSQVPERPYL